MVPRSTALSSPSTAYPHRTAEAISAQVQDASDSGTQPSRKRTSKPTQAIAYAVEQAANKNERQQKAKAAKQRRALAGEARVSVAVRSELEELKQKVAELEEEVEERRGMSFIISNFVVLMLIPFCESRG